METNKNIVKYKNEMNKMDITKLSGTDLKIFMAICCELKDQGTNELYIDFTDLKSMVGMETYNNDKFFAALENVCQSLATVVYIYEELQYKNGKRCVWKIEPKVFFKKFEINYNEKNILVSIHDDMVHMLNDWEGGRWSQFALDTFNSIKGVSAKQLFRLLIQYSEYPKMYITLDEAMQILGCSSYRPNDFVDKTLNGAMKQFENLGIIFPGWSVERIKGRKNSVLKLVYVLHDDVKMISTHKNPPKKENNLFFEGQLALLKQLGKPDSYIKCFEETGDINKADILFKFRQEHGEDVDFNDLVELENKNKIAYLDRDGVAIIDERELFGNDEFPFF